MRSSPDPFFPSKYKRKSGLATRDYTRTLKKGLVWFTMLTRSLHINWLRGVDDEIDYVLCNLLFYRLMSLWGAWVQCVYS